ncbi:UDP-3-O-acyl-N-acetylglucosamine deacetylase [Leptolyngbya sp. NIES-2104]|uniref:UDP-3-O-acyl-N-acetylglucosamine deacetylase n=1 Tax=Leptolyngbya sp. NIES-2104 TaxID=1552121 RepID=UPI0006EC7B9C|nr:UDP-3-O-acyl-N-acetylglucosamine deacetylase [Leptolyngbya sp. NIES-2104]GAP97048.1 UDP-3-O-[3-hydroxymyristoyl] N-acetylglucosamine deacetylase [Leptolyngbya sp. NIES-2104]
MVKTQGCITSTVQRSLSSPFSCYGIGLHTGETTTARVLPAEPGRGRYFVRTDLPGQPEIPAQIEAVRETMLSTELVNGEAEIRTVEHLLASLAGMGIDNARIEVDGSEVPLMDGSARSWTSAIAQAGIVEQTEAKSSILITEPVFVRKGDAFVAALPSDELRFSYGIDFELSAIGNQWHSWRFDPETFATEIAPARTFGFAHQIEQLRANGLIKGGSLENALVCSTDGWINPPLRFSNEPARHKLLDLIGDLSLLGTFPTAHFLAYKASHGLHTQLVRQLSNL